MTNEKHGYEFEWKNFGDVNPIEHGGFWIKPDEDSGNCFHVVEWSPTTENVGLLATGYVDISDSWIDWRAVTSYADLHDDSTDAELVKALFEYYSAEDFGGSEVSIRTSALVATLMEDHGIPFTPEMMPDYDEEDDELTEEDEAEVDFEPFDFDPE